MLTASTATTPGPLDHRHGSSPIRQGDTILRSAAAELVAEVRTASGRTYADRQEWADGSGGQCRGPTTSMSGSNDVIWPGRPPHHHCCSVRTGDWNALHRDLYGELMFPLQVVIGLDCPGWTTQAVSSSPSSSAARRGAVPRHHHAIGTGTGAGLHTRERPVPLAGLVGRPMRHGDSVLRSGRRHALARLHDAR